MALPLLGVKLENVIFRLLKGLLMFLYLGAAVSVKKSDIIGIFDIDNVNTQKTTKEFLRTAEREKKLILAGEDLPKSFLLTGKPRTGRSRSSGEDQVILCKLSARSLCKRAEQQEEYEKEK